MRLQKNWLDEYWKHTALNLGQAARDLRYFSSHPDADSFAPEGCIRHRLLSAGFRLRSFVNNLFYSVIPPHWHHTPQELAQMHPGSARRWFLHGYAPWTYPAPEF